MIAVDTNILVYAHREEAPWHGRAKEAMNNLGASHWALPWPCVHEFLSIVTHPRVFDPPTPLADALLAAQRWVKAPRVRMLAEFGDYWDVVAQTLHDSHTTGPKVHDARVAALCRQHGVAELWTADRDFHRFAGLKTRNPLVP